MMIRALVFDFDGTILDTEEPEYHAWQATYSDYGCELPLEVWAKGIGGQNLFDPYTYLETVAGKAVDRGSVRRTHRERYEELISGLAVLPGVEDYIADAKRLGLRLGLASSSNRDWVTGHLSQTGLLDDFDIVKTADDVANTKPDPELYLAALTALGVTGEEAIALEDSPIGVTAAQKAGIFCVAIPNVLTAQLSLEHADLRMASLTEMPLEELLSRL